MFAIPMLIGNIAQQLYNTVDSIVVGRYVGDNALAAVGSAGPILNLLLVLFVGISVGAGIIVSQYFGAKEKEELAGAIGCSITLTAVLCEMMDGMDEAQAIECATQALDGGEAWEAFCRMVRAQGGDMHYIEQCTNHDNAAAYRREVRATRSGYIAHMDAQKIGLCAMRLGAGREKKDDIIDLNAGIQLCKKTGDTVQTGDVIATLFTEDESRLNSAEKTFLDALTYTETPVPARALVLGCVRACDIT